MGNLLKQRQMVNNITKELLGEIQTKEELLIAIEYVCDKLRIEVRKVATEYILTVLEEGEQMLEDYMDILKRREKMIYKFDDSSCKENREMLKEAIQLTEEFRKYANKLHKLPVLKYDRKELNILREILTESICRISQSLKEYDILEELLVQRLAITIEEEEKSLAKLFKEDLHVLVDKFNNILIKNNELTTRMYEAGEEILKRYNKEKQTKKELKDRSYSTKEVIDILNRNGYSLERNGKGSHQVFKNNDGETIIVSNHTKDIKVGLKNKYLERIYNI